MLRQRIASGLLCSGFKVGVIMQSLPIILMVVGCEPVTPSGNPLQPASVAQTSAPDAAQEDAGGHPDNAEEEKNEEEGDQFKISSEELNQLANGELPTRTQEPPAADAPEASADPPAPAPADAEVKSGWGDSVGKAWPVRLVTTVPNASPPRAILGLPNGKEIVVNPGTMVPDMGLVVVAISPNSAELARIAPAGDHATIESMTLRAQY
jgi:hypothetical protein